MRRKRKGKQSLARLARVQRRYHPNVTNEECVDVTDGSDYLSGLPLEVVLDIIEITGSTFKTIACCRCVCKSWRDTLSGPYFVKLHSLTTSSQNQFILFGAQDVHRKKVWNFGFLQCRRTGDETCSPRTACSDFSDISTSFSKLFALEYKFSNRECLVLGSCKGLLLWWTNMNKIMRLFISNPISKEYMAIPGILLFQQDARYGFGFSPKTNQYKVIRLHVGPYSYYARRYRYDAHVHTIGTQTWRYIKDIPCLCPCYGCVFLDDDGTLNWVGFSPTSDKISMVYSFDIETEQFRPLVLLPFHDLDNKWHLHDYNIQLGLYGDCLCIVRHYKANTEIWILQKNHIWMKNVVITPSIRGSYRCYGSCNFGRFTNYDYRVTYISVLENGEIIFIKHSISSSRTSLVSYNPMNKNNKSTSIDMDFGISHVPSFISIKDVVAAGKEDGRVMKAPCKVSFPSETEYDAFYIYR